MNEIRFYLNMSSQEYLRYYQGNIDSIIVTLDDGRRIQFPAKALQKYVDSNGVRGAFRILFNENNKMTVLERV